MMNNLDFTFFPEIGKGWAPAVLDTQEEFDFIRIGQKTFTNSAPYWIGGSTNEPNDTTDYTKYIANNSGTITARWYSRHSN